MHYSQCTASSTRDKSDIGVLTNLRNIIGLLYHCLQCFSLKLYLYQRSQYITSSVNKDVTFTVNNRFQSYRSSPVSQMITRGVQVPCGGKTVAPPVVVAAIGNIECQLAPSRPRSRQPVSRFAVWSLHLRQQAGAVSVRTQSQDCVMTFCFPLHVGSLCK